MSIEVPRKPNPGPPFVIRWFAFLGWLGLPIAATALVVMATHIQVLWWGPTWFAFALAYMIFYFRWSRKKYPKPE